MAKKIKPEEVKILPKESGGQPGNKNAEKWTEEKALELGNRIIDWMKDPDKPQNIFVLEILIELGLHKDTVTYLTRKFDSFLYLLKQAQQIQELKLIKYGTANKLNSAITIFVLKNHHGYTDKQEPPPDDEDNLKELATDELIKRAQAAKTLETS